MAIPVRLSSRTSPAVASTSPTCIAEFFDTTATFLVETFPRRMLSKALTVSEVLLALSALPTQVDPVTVPKQTPKVSVAMTMVFGVPTLSGFTRVPAKVSVDCP